MIRKEVFEGIKRFVRSLPFEVIYAGVVGSAVVRDDYGDVDVVAISSEDVEPMLFHEGEISVLLIGKDWLSYEKHEIEPKGLVPSILFRAIQLSLPVLGDKSEILSMLPRIEVCDADFMNVEIKKRRYENVDRKNYLVAVVFEELLKRSVRYYEFDIVRVARNLGLMHVAEELERASVRGVRKKLRGRKLERSCEERA